MEFAAQACDTELWKFANLTPASVTLSLVEACVGLGVLWSLTASSRNGVHENQQKRLMDSMSHGPGSLQETYRRLHGGQDHRRGTNTVASFVRANTSHRKI